ncbi:MAG: ribosomal protein S18-alanine N-acetyltransferase [Pseudomonadota bacterium]
MSQAREFAALHARAFAAEEAWPEAAFADLLDLPTTEFAQIKDGDQVVSFILVQFAAGEADILTLATAPELRRQGYAQRLLTEIETRLRPRGLQKWLLDVAADNIGARGFYEALGFQCDGRRKDYYKRLEGGRVDAMLMSKLVGGQAP